MILRMNLENCSAMRANKALLGTNLRYGLPKSAALAAVAARVSLEEKWGDGIGKI